MLIPALPFAIKDLWALQAKPCPAATQPFVDDLSETAKPAEPEDGEVQNARRL